MSFFVNLDARRNNSSELNSKQLQAALRRSAGRIGHFRDRSGTALIQYLSYDAIKPFWKTSTFYTF